MDSGRAQGSVLLCSPSPELSSVCCGPSTSGCNFLGESGNAIKPKKKRLRHKQRNPIKEGINSVPNTLENQDDCNSTTFATSLASMEGMIELLENLQTGVSELKKTKRIKKRKKKCTIDGNNDELSDKCTTEEVVDNIPSIGRNEVELSPGVIKKPTPSNKREKQTQTPGKHIDSPVLDSRKRRSRAKNKPESEGGLFEPYLTADEVQEGLKDKTMVAGAIRINPRCYKEAYISSEGDEKDIMIEGLKNRNRALEGDEVVVLINPREAWKVQQRTGTVVCIREEFHTRKCIGKLPTALEPNGSYIVFSPRDPRIPRIKIPLSDSSLPASYLQDPSLYSETLFNAQITAWPETNFAEGVILREVGKCGDVEVETMAIMLENNLDPEPINPVLNLFFPRMPYTIPEGEIAKREDLRKECIFTIDPATARDLDDAVSAKNLDNGNIEVGIHISDVSHFLQYNTLLDYTVSKRATTVYLVQRVYHMLPVELCQLCSLTPGEDKLAFSVFVQLTPDAQVVSHRFARTVINSCTKLAYEHAQMVIDNPEKTFTEEDFPEIVSGFTAEDCAARIRELYSLSLIMRSRRFASGALRIDQPKLCFHLDQETNIPKSSFIYENKESHRLIEEFMLLANMVVAEHIYEAYPSLAFLRHHMPPRGSMLLELQKRLEMYGIHLDTSNAGTMHRSMARYSSPVEGEDEELSWARFTVLNNLCAKPMLRANYFCPSDEVPDMHHYALNASCYTHFTSPIRRYPDVMVHRLLAASLDLGPQPAWTPLDSKRIAAICNRQKLSAKTAGEQSSLVFLALYLSEPVESKAAVIDVKDRSFDVIVRAFGIMLRVYTDPIPGKAEYCNDDNMAQLTIQWQSGQLQVIQLFSVVRVLVSRTKAGLKLAATLLPPPLSQYTLM